MTIPSERTSAIVRAEQFLLDLMSPQKTPRVPQGIRAQARSILRHYPSRHDLHIAHQHAPRVFGALPPTLNTTSGEGASEAQSDLTDAKGNCS